MFFGPLLSFWENVKVMFFGDRVNSSFKEIANNKNNDFFNQVEKMNTGSRSIPYSLAVIWTLIMTPVHFLTILHYEGGALSLSLSWIYGPEKAFELLTPPLTVLLAPDEGGGTHLAFYLGHQIHSWTHLAQLHLLSLVSAHIHMHVWTQAISTCTHTHTPAVVDYQRTSACLFCDLCPALPWTWPKTKAQACVLLHIL